MTVPILDNDGRTVLHHAKTEAAARRSALALEVNGGLDGWMYSIGN
jgi:hypothetical protein